MNLVKFGRLLKLNYSNWGCASVQLRCLSTGNTQYTKTAPNKKPNWNRAVSEAEKIVGYPTSFLNLRWLLSDEVANVALHLRKLVGSEHPLLKTAKDLLYNGKNNMQAWGLIVLLISKAAGHSPNISDLDKDKAAGVLQGQRALAEITEMIRTSQMVHKGLINLNPSIENDADMLFGNKIALLSGDYLLSNSSMELASLKDQELIEIMSVSLRDQAEGEFIGPRDEQNNPLPAKPQSGTNPAISEIGTPGIQPIAVVDVLGNAEAEWTLRHVLSGGSLLGKSCQGTMKIAGHSIEMQEKGYLFGKHLALAWQACLDRKPFEGLREGSFSLISAPVMFQLQHDPSLYSEIEKGMKNIKDIDYDVIYDAVLSGPGLEKTRALQKEHSQTVLDILHQLPPTDARTALTNIIFAMEEL